MRDIDRIDDLIRAARVQRSVALGRIIGDFLGSSWVIARKMLALPAGSKSRHIRLSLPAR